MASTQNMSKSTPPMSKLMAPKKPNVLLMKASSAEGFKPLADSLEKRLTQQPDQTTKVCCEAAEATRNKTGFTWAVAGHNTPSLIAELRRGAPKADYFKSIESVPADRRRMLFVYSGQGSELVGSWHEVYNTNMTFATMLDNICSEAKTVHGLRLGAALGIEADNQRPAVMSTEYLQPSIFAIQVALTEAWTACGIAADAVVGHSFGEYAAAVAVGAMTWQQGLAIVVKRAAMMAALPPDGAMMAVFQSEEDIRKVLTQRRADLAVACVNAPTVTVLSGTAAEMTKFEAACAAAGGEVRGKRLTTVHAFHSKHMRPMLEGFSAAVGAILSADGAAPTDPAAAAAPRPRFLSTVRPGWLPAAELRTPTYWSDHTEKAVRFADALGVVKQEGKFTVVVEVGPGADLMPAVKRCLLGPAAPAVSAACMRPPAPAGGAPPAGGSAFDQAVAAVVTSPWGAGHVADWWKLFSEDCDSESPEATAALQSLKV